MMILNFKYNIGMNSTYIPYTQVVKKINGKDFKKYYVINAKKLTPEQMNIIIDNIEEFNSQLLSEDYYNPHTSPCSLFLYFVGFPQELAPMVENNVEYSLKRLITLEEYERLLTSSDNFIVKTRSTIHKYNGTNIKCGNFNLLYGLNGSGKTMFLRCVSEQTNAPIFTLSTRFDDPNHVITSASEAIENFRKILNYCEKDKSPLLLDDIGWGRFDEKNTVKIIDELNDFSLENDTYITSARTSIKSLVNRRVYNPNIVDMNKYRNW